MKVVAAILKFLIRDLGIFFKVKVLPLAVKVGIFVAFFSARWMDPVLERAFAALGTVLARWLFTSEPSRRAFRTIWGQLYETVAWNYQALVYIGFLALGALVISVGLPLLQRFMTRRRVAVFLSFNRTREDAAGSLQSSLNSQGVNVTRIPYKDGAPHQEIVQAVSQGIRECNALLCVPGVGATFVDSEVMAAGAGGKAVIFLLSERDGTLPNTADKRYPVFKLEESEAHRFEPLIRFLRYIGCDFASLVDIFRSSLWSSVRLLFRSRRGHLLLTLTLGAIGACSYFDVYREGTRVTSTSQRQHERAAAVLANSIVFGLVSIGCLFIAEYAVVALASNRKQGQAQKRAVLEVTAATFSRDDWIGLVPGLEEGSAMYQCMFERPAFAHHELKLAASV